MVESIRKTITNEHRLQVNVGFLVAHNLRSKDWDVVACIRFACNVEVLLSVLGKLFEEQGEQSINVLASCDGIANTASAVREADVHGLIEENDRRIRIP